MSKQDRQGVRTVADLERKYRQLLVGLEKATKNNTTGVTKLNKALEDFANTILGTIENLQTQIDGSITIWFYSGAPTLSNVPTNEWTTEKEKRRHLGDLYYDKETGYAYRFISGESGYEWFKLTDNDVVEALAIANAANDTADSKRRVFTETPYVPYDIGDLWIKEDEELYRCQYSRKMGDEYNVESDFVLATKYTDDTYAKNVEDYVKENYSTTSETKTLIELSEQGIRTHVSETYTSKEDFSTETKALGEDIKKVETTASQTAKKFEWLVKSGTSETNFVLTEEMAELIAKVISLNGNVKVNGNMIVDNAITSDKVDVNNLIVKKLVVTEEDDSYYWDETIVMTDGTRKVWMNPTQITVENLTFNNDGYRYKTIMTPNAFHLIKMSSSNSQIICNISDNPDTARFLNNPFADFVVAEGTTNGWTWEKWYSGKAKCWTSVSASIPASAWTLWGSNYYADISSACYIAYPFTFKSIQIEHKTLQGPSGVQMWLSLNVGNSDRTKATSYGTYALRSTKPSATVTPIIDFYVVGTY